MVKGDHVPAEQVTLTGLGNAVFRVQNAERELKAARKALKLAEAAFVEEQLEVLRGS